MILKKGNIERVAEDAIQASKWKIQGYQFVGDDWKKMDNQAESTQGEWEKKTDAQLRALVKKKGVMKANSMSRQELLAALMGADTDDGT